MSLPPRAVTILGLVQVAVIMGGFLIARAFRNVWDKTYGDWLDPSNRIPLIARIMHSCGPLLLVIPAAWILFWFLQYSKHEQKPESDRAVSVMGIIITILLIFLVAVGVAQSIGALSMKTPMRQLDG